MTDRELLELAAKAAEMPYKWLPLLSGMYHIIDAGKIDGPWNPLTDDGDALRLAVKLMMQVDILQNSVYALAHNGGRVCELDRADLHAATRRAITRAAAEIGRTK